MEHSDTEYNKAYLIPYPIESFSKPLMIRNKITSIGRSHDDDLQIQIDDKHVSRKHACIYFDNGQFFIEDLNSVNYTFVNRQKIPVGAPYPIHDGDDIRLGRVLLRFRTS